MSQSPADLWERAHRLVVEIDRAQTQMRYAEEPETRDAGTAIYSRKLDELFETMKQLKAFGALADIGHFLGVTYTS